MLLYWMLPGQAARAREWVRGGATQQGRTPPVVASYVRVALGHGASRRLREEEASIAPSTRPMQAVGCVNPAGAKAIGVGVAVKARPATRRFIRLPRSFPPRGGHDACIADLPRAAARVLSWPCCAAARRTFKELEIVVVRHELAILRRQHGRPKLDPGDRVFLAAASRLLARGALELLARHAGHAATLAPPAGREAWTYARRRPRPPCGRRRAQSAGARARARESALGLSADRRRAHGLWGQRLSDHRAQARGPSAPRTHRRQGRSVLARAPAVSGSEHRLRLLHRRDLTLRRIYVPFFIELGSRRVHLAGVAENPGGAWVTRQARHVAWSLPQRATAAR
jgi:hypothetical protein